MHAQQRAATKPPSPAESSPKLSLRVSVGNGLPRIDLLNRRANVAEEVDFVNHALVLGNIEDNRSRMSTLRQDQRPPTALDMLDQFGRIGSELRNGSDVGVQLYASPHGTSTRTFKCTSTTRLNVLYFGG